MSEATTRTIRNGTARPTLRVVACAAAIATVAALPGAVPAHAPAVGERLVVEAGPVVRGHAVCVNVDCLPPAALVSVSPDGRDRHTIPGCVVARGGLPCSDWAFSPDRRFAAFHRGGQLLIATANGAIRHRVGLGSDLGFAWSPDSRWVAYIEPDPHPTCNVEGRACDGDVYIERDDGTQRRQLTHDNHATAPIAWPAANAIVYRGCATGCGAPIAVDPRDGHTRPLDLGPAGGVPSEMTWSRDGRQLALLAQLAPGRATLVIERANSAKPVELQLVAASLLSWAPDGRSLAFVGSRRPSSGSALYLVRNDGKRLHPLIVKTRRGRLRRRLPVPQRFVWSPDSTRLALSFHDAISVIRRDGTHLKPVLARGHFDYVVDAWG